jgi:hypothetical protein
MPPAAMRSVTINQAGQMPGAKAPRSAARRSSLRGTTVQRSVITATSMRRPVAGGRTVHLALTGTGMAETDHLHDWRPPRDEDWQRLRALLRAVMTDPDADSRPQRRPRRVPCREFLHLGITKYHGGRQSEATSTSIVPAQCAQRPGRAGGTDTSVERPHATQYSR